MWVLGLMKCPCCYRKVLSASQLEFFRQLDQKIEQVNSYHQSRNGTHGKCYHDQNISQLN